MTCTAWIAGLALALLPTARPHCPAPPAPGRLVSVSIEIDGSPTPLLPARDGSGRLYLEARPGSSYAVRLVNQTRESLGVELRVDGLDVISGKAPPEHGRGRLYILAPRGSTLVRGWRSSLDAVQRFEFVDERASYASRTHAPGARLGWIEARVFREQRVPDLVSAPERPATSPPRASAGEAEDAARAEGRQARRAPSHPGTGWGQQLGDRAVVVDFAAEAAPAESLVLRYEYADALHALGIDPGCHPWSRLWERENGEGGFAQPPRH